MAPDPFIFSNLRYAGIQDVPPHLLIHAPASLWVLMGAAVLGWEDGTGPVLGYLKHSLELQIST